VHFLGFEILRYGAVCGLFLKRRGSRHRVPEDLNRQPHSYQNLKYHIFFCILKQLTKDCEGADPAQLTYKDSKGYDYEN